MQSFKNIVSKYPQSTLDFINCVTNPFECAVPGRIVDNDPQMSMPWKDYSVNNGLSFTVSTTTPTACQGIALFLLIGSNQYAEHSVISNASYSLLAILLDNNGDQISAYAIAQANYSSLGNYTEQYRFVSAGIRAKCLIEQVTVSTTVAVSRMYAGSMKPSDGYTAYSGPHSYFTLAQQMDCLATFDNSQGATVRLDPFQQIIDFKKYRAYGDWTDYSSFNGNTYVQPSIIVQFMNPVPVTIGTSTSTYSIPLIVESIFWLEVLLNKPTPLYCTPSPCDLNYDFIASVLSRACEGEFPVVTKFNSFKNFMNSTGRFAVAAGRAIAQTSIIPSIINAASTRFLGGPIVSNQPLIRKQMPKQAAPVKQPKLGKKKAKNKGKRKGRN